MLNQGGMSIYQIIFGLLNLMGLFKISQQVLSSRHSKSYVEHINITDCEPGKKELLLRTGATAIFYFNETEQTNLARKSDFSCHYELEVSKTARKKYGFHVYIEEMFLRRNGKKCYDYIQFARDKGFLTTYTSNKYCGERWRLDLLTTPLQYRSQGSRFYVEETQGEMDVFVEIQRATSIFSKPRYLKMTITVFKKNCESDDENYKACPYTNHCIRKEFFCDGRPNCAWSIEEKRKETVTDEHKCDKKAKGSNTDSSGTSTNVLVLIICSLAATAMAVILVVFIYKCIKLQRQRMRTDAIIRADRARVSVRTINPRPDTTDSRSTTNYQQPPSDSPPSYAKAIAENPGLLSRGTPIAPPSYSEALIADQNRSELSNA